MVTAKMAQGIADRLERAKALVADGAVLPVAGLIGYAVVRNGDGDSMYLVRTDAGHERCTCPDFSQRQGAAGLPCKHLMAAQLALGSNPQPPAPVAVAVAMERTADPVEAAGHAVAELLLAPSRRRKAA